MHSLVSVGRLEGHLSVAEGPYLLQIGYIEETWCPALKVPFKVLGLPPVTDLPVPKQDAKAEVPNTSPKSKKGTVFYQGQVQGNRKLLL